MFVITDDFSERDGWLATLIRAAQAEAKEQRDGGRGGLSR